MKKIRYYSLTVLLSIVLLFMSCSKVLDRQPDNQVSEAVAFASWDKVNSMAGKLYRDLRDRDRGIVGLTDFSISGIDDECKGTLVETAIPDQFNFGSFGPSIGMPGPGKTLGIYWGDFYNSIRKCNVFLRGVELYKSQDNPLQPGDLKNRIAEAHFMRAYIHYLASRWYGDVVYMDYVAELTGDLKFVRQSWPETLKKMLVDVDFAINDLPVRHIDGEYGRVDKGAAMGFKAILLYINASPIYNGGKLPGSDTRVGQETYSTYDKEKWKLAADAAKAVMDLKDDNGALRYTLYQGQASNFQAQSNNMVYARLKQIYIDPEAKYSEYLLVSNNSKNSAWQGDHIPPSSGGAARLQPLQEQVDEYEFKGNDGYGYAIYDPQAQAKGYDENLPYVNRDPRFYADVMYHGCTYQNAIINTATGSDRIGAGNATSTGYYLRKFFHEDWKRNGTDFQINFPMIRLPEIQLIYAEAMNKYSGPSSDIYTVVNDLRARSFMSPVPPGLDQAALHKYIQRERRVEFFYENKRYFYARWNLEPDSDIELAQEAAANASDTPENVVPYPKTQRVVHGMRPVVDPTGTYIVGGIAYKMQRFKLENRVFTSKNYFWPLVTSEITNCPSLLQSPNW